MIGIKPNAANANTTITVTTSVLSGSFVRYKIGEPKSKSHHKKKIEPTIKPSALFEILSNTKCAQYTKERNKAH